MDRQLFLGQYTAKDRARIRQALRQTFSWSEQCKAIKNRARVQKGIYQCDKCGQFAKKVEVDHVIPIGKMPTARNSDTDWNGFMARFFCGEDGLQALCRDCHEDKTRTDRTGART